MEKRAFYDPDTKVLTGRGFMYNNCRIETMPLCDPYVEVPWDFELELFKWRLVDGTANPPTWEPVL